MSNALDILWKIRTETFPLDLVNEKSLVTWTIAVLLVWWGRRLIFVDSKEDSVESIMEIENHNFVIIDWGKNHQVAKTTGEKLLGNKTA